MSEVRRPEPKGDKQDPSQLSLLGFSNDRSTSSGFYNSRRLCNARLFFESADRFLEFFVKAFAHQHHVGDTGAHVDGEKMLVQDTRKDNVQESAFDRDTASGIALFIAFPTMS